MNAEGRWMDAIERLGESPVRRGCYFVGFRDWDRLYVELRETPGEWVRETIPIADLTEIQTYITLDDDHTL